MYLDGRFCTLICCKFGFKFEKTENLNEKEANLKRKDNFGPSLGIEPVFLELKESSITTMSMTSIVLKMVTNLDRMKESHQTTLP